MTHYQLTTPELRANKPSRAQFASKPKLPLYILLDGVRTAYNVGAILRLADAVGACQVFVRRPEYPIGHRALTTTAKGTTRWVDWQLVEDSREVLLSLRRAGVKLVAVELTSQSMDYRSLTVSEPLCLILGEESGGVSQPVLDLVDQAIHLPMYGMGNSINVASAAAIALYHAAGQLQAGLPPDGTSG